MLCFNCGRVMTCTEQHPDQGWDGYECPHCGYNDVFSYDVTNGPDTPICETIGHKWLTVHYGGEAETFCERCHKVDSSR